MSRRMIHQSQTGARAQIRELLEALFVAELLCPSTSVYLVSPWVRDIELIDNRSGSYRALGPRWGRRRIRLAEILAVLVARGTTVTLATRPLPENSDFIRLVEERLASTEQARFRVHEHASLHTKGLVGDGYAVSGSMNFTHSGIQNNTELLHYETEPSAVAALRLEFESEYA